MTSRACGESAGVVPHPASTMTAATDKHDCILFVLCMVIGRNCAPVVRFGWFVPSRESVTQVSFFVQPSVIRSKVFLRMVLVDLIED